MVQLLSIDIIRQLGEQPFQGIELSQIDRLNVLLQENYRFSCKFNENIEHRYRLWMDGFMGGKEGMKVLPGLLK